MKNNPNVSFPPVALRSIFQVQGGDFGQFWQLLGKVFLKARHNWMMDSTGFISSRSLENPTQMLHVYEYVQYLHVPLECGHFSPFM